MQVRCDVWFDHDVRLDTSRAREPQLLTDHDSRDWHVTISWSTLRVHVHDMNQPWLTSLLFLATITLQSSREEAYM